MLDSLIGDLMETPDESTPKIEVGKTYLWTFLSMTNITVRIVSQNELVRDLYHAVDAQTGEDLLVRKRHLKEVTETPAI